MSKYEPINPMPYAVVKKWRDNPSGIQVIEYFYTEREARDYLRDKNKSKEYEWEVMKYE